MHCFLGKLSHWLVILPLVLTAIAQPVVPEDVADFSNSTVFEDNAELSPNTLPEWSVGAYYLRILPIGGSITAGWGSSTGNGLVKWKLVLYDKADFFQVS